MVTLLIAISPPKKISENIISLRKYLVQKTGLNPFKDTKAHITLLVNTFPNFKDVDKELKNLVKSYKPFMAEIEKIDGFGYDPIWKATTVIYKVKGNKEISDLQKEIFEKIAPLRDDEQVKWLLQQNNKFSKEAMKNIKKYGYPYGPKGWSFHTSIAVVPKEDYKKLQEYIKKFDLNIKWKVDHIHVLKYYGDKGFKYYKKYKLGN
ncbi:MAG: 2'-5' RNA ligase family protein [Nanoarchaeota archaeon]|nr:2'-5' RNA ligase family protein [Nanoarchaeota archaeon]